LARFPIAVQAKKTYVIGVGTAAGTLNSLASDFTFALGARPANDDLQHAKVIAKHAKASKPRGLVKGSTEFAGLQAHERLLQQHVGGADTWYAFVAPKAGRYRFMESLKRGYPVLSAYSGRGHDILGLKRVKAGRGKNYNKPVTIKLGAKAGQRFELSVDGLTGYWGKYRLSWKKV
jgi:hypothetical protein